MKIEPKPVRAQNRPAISVCDTKNKKVARSNFGSVSKESHQHWLTVRHQCLRYTGYLGHGLHQAQRTRPTVDAVIYAAVIIVGI